MTKVIIQVPCYNEEGTLGITLSALPRELPGVDEVEWLVVDDGSTDTTAAVAKAHGVDHIVRLPRNQGLAKAFMAGISTGLRAGADVIVNTDADNQYCAADIPKLIRPILDGKAEFAIGCRPIQDIAHFSPVKKLFQRLGSWVVRFVSKTDIPDAPSGFRALSRNVAMRLNVFNDYTYTLETIIQAGQANMAVGWVPVRVNQDLRPSRLIKSDARYVWRSVVTIIRIFLLYKAFRSLFVISVVITLPGVLLGVRFLYYFAIGQGQGHTQSVILGAGMGFLVFISGILSDLISVNRKLLEDVRQRAIYLEEGTAAGETTEGTKERLRKVIDQT
jgi:glycosyltransferase involved in cell wall biosynthesis